MIIARWRLKNAVLAKKNMTLYFKLTSVNIGFRAMPRTTLPRIINQKIAQIKQTLAERALNPTGANSQKDGI